MTTETMSQPQFVQEVQHRCANKESGSLIAQTGGTLATITLEDGEIVALGFRILKGHEALEQFRTLGESKVSFRPNMLRERQPDLPTTDEIIYLLGETSATESVLTTRSGQTMTQPELHQYIEQEATTVLGPASQMLCAEYFDQHPSLIDANDIRQAVIAIVGSVAGTEAETMANNVIKKLGL